MDAIVSIFGYGGLGGFYGAGWGPKNIGKFDILWTCCLFRQGLRSFVDLKMLVAMHSRSYL
eukprot:42225-Amphidinium_carterae.1